MTWSIFAIAAGMIKSNWPATSQGTGKRLEGRQSEGVFPAQENAAHGGVLTFTIKAGLHRGRMKAIGVRQVKTWASMTYFPNMISMSHHPLPEKIAWRR